MYANTQGKVAEIRNNILEAYSNIHRAHTYFRENWERLFGEDKDDIITDFVEIYRNDKDLQHAVSMLNHWIGIDEWKRINKETRLRRKRNNLFAYKN